MAEFLGAPVHQFALFRGKDLDPATLACVKQNASK
jgi:hypothetical protein